jgi:Acyl-coenzyme A:6-aminopenicillanic acid acyl-transferase
MKRIYASGDPYSIGQEIGREIADTVHRVTLDNEEFSDAENRWLGSDYIKQMKEEAQQFAPQYMLELEGMADGMQIDLERAFIWNCRGDLRWPDDISPALAFSLSEGCTSVILPEDDQKPAIIGHNEDGGAEFANNCFWVSVKPDNAPGYESFLYPGMLAGHSMGANYAGIVQTINNIRVHDLKPGIPRHFIARAILDCTSMEQVQSLLKRDDRASGFHHNIGSAKEGLLASIEAPASGCAVRHIADAPKSHANHLIYPELSELQQSITKSSKVRQTRSEKLLGQGALDNHDPSKVLFDKQKGSEILRRPTDGGDDYGQTLATGIFELTPETVKISVHDGPENRDMLIVDMPLK